MNALHYFQALCQVQYIPIDDILRCGRYLQDKTSIEDYSYSADGLITFLNETNWEQWQAKGASAVDRIFFEQLIIDTRAALSNLNEDSSKLIDEEADFATISQKMFALIESELGSLGLNVPDAKIEFVDDFPGVYAGRDYMALTIDEGDRQEHGLTPGVYIKKSKYIPIFGRTIFLHEFIHVILGKAHPFELARGLEEGICELIGFIYLGCKALPISAVRNSFIYLRLRDQQLSMWSTYRDYTRQARALYDLYGLNGVAEIIRRGRPEIKRIEQELLSHTSPSLDLVAGEFDPVLTDNLRWLLDIYTPEMTVSPEGYRLAQLVERGITTKELHTISKLNDIEFQRGIKDLEGHVRIATLREDRSVVAFCDNYQSVNPYSIRYRVPSG